MIWSACLLLDVLGVTAFTTGSFKVAYALISASSVIVRCEVADSSFVVGRAVISDSLDHGSTACQVIVSSASIAGSLICWGLACRSAVSYMLIAGFLNCVLSALRATALCVSIAGSLSRGIWGGVSGSEERWPSPRRRRIGRRIGRG